MSTKKLKDVLKNAQEVTLLSATDRVLTCDTNGNPRKISKGNLNSNEVSFYLPENAGAGKWIRVATMPYTAIGFIFITNGWMDSINIPAVLMVTGAHCNGIQVASAIPFRSSSRYPKARFVYKPGDSTNTVYLELNIKSLTVNDMIVIQKVGDNINLVNGYTAGTVPEGYSVKELDLTTSVIGGGGVNRYSTTRYTILQKGGLRNGYEKAYQFTPEDKDVGCGAFPRKSHRHRHFDNRRILVDRRHHHIGLSSSVFRIHRHSGGIRKEWRCASTRYTDKPGRHVSEVLFNSSSLLVWVVQILWSSSITGKEEVAACVQRN